MSTTPCQSRPVILMLGTTLALALALSAHADQPAALGFERTIPADGAERISIDVPAGQLIVQGAPVDEVGVEVSIDCSAGLFESSCARRARRIELDVDRRDERIGVRLKRFRLLSSMGLQVRVQVTVPSGLDVSAGLGLGELEVAGVSGTVRVDLGIGEVDVHDVSGAVYVDSGIGEVTIVMEERAVESVHIDLGIGESSLHRPDGRVVKAGVLGSETGWTSGVGSSKVRVDLGVGEATVDLH